MVAHVQRWFLLITAIIFLAMGCLNISQAWGQTLVMGQLAAGLFYCFVGGSCMWKHVSAVAGDWDDEESWSSY